MRSALGAGALVTMLVGGPAAHAAECPPTSAVAELLSLPLSDAYRTRVMELEPPVGLYREAVRRPDVVAVERDGKLGQAAVVVPLPIESVWKTLNDDDHHDEGGYIPIRESQVIGGRPGGGGRTTFQYFKRAGVGRWWVNRLEMNAGLYRASAGRLWELSWQDVLEEYPGEEPPVAIEDSVPKIVGSRGAWLLARLGDGCTLVEYVTRGEPGGVIGALQFLAASRTLRDTVEGMVEMTRDHLEEPHPTVRFVRPDGTPLDEDPAG